MKAVCYKCNNEYEVKMETEAQKEAVDNLVENFDPTDWECADCSQAEYDFIQAEGQEEAE